MASSQQQRTREGGKGGRAVPGLERSTDHGKEDDEIGDGKAVEGNLPRISEVKNTEEGEMLEAASPMPNSRKGRGSLPGVTDRMERKKRHSYSSSYKQDDQAIDVRMKNSITAQLVPYPSAASRKFLLPLFPPPYWSDHILFMSAHSLGSPLLSTLPAVEDFTHLQMQIFFPAALLLWFIRRAVWPPTMIKNFCDDLLIGISNEVDRETSWIGFIYVACRTRIFMGFFPCFFNS